jgi:hypothetical protein
MPIVAADPVEDCADESKACKFNSTPSPRWQAAVNDAAWDGDVKVLPCPRCGHTMNVDASAAAASLTTSEIGELARDTSRLSGFDPELAETGLKAVIADLETGRKKRVAARCNCMSEHAGHPPKPDDVFWGCGQTGAIDAPTR